MSQDLLIAMSALGAHQRAIEVGSHNIANAATPGYSRQRAELGTQTPQTVRPGQLGRGVQIEDIRRIAEDMLTSRMRRGESETGRLESLATTLKGIELFFNEPGENGLAQVTNQLFAVFEDVANNPESSALRATAVQQLRTFSDSLNALGAQLDAARADLRSAVEGELTQINDIAAQVAVLNQQIRTQTALTNQPNDLLDRRDQLLMELAKHAGIRVRIEPRDQAATVDINGFQLIGPESADALRIGSETADGSFGIVGRAGTGLRPEGGSIAALMELHRDIIPGVIARMDSFATTTALELNARHATGTSQTMRAVSFTGATGIGTALLDVNLDDSAQARAIGDDTGIAAAYLPSFTDASGQAVARNLTINVYNPTTGTAEKFTLRYDPQTGSGTRSLDDLVQAINTGHGGGFTLYPPRAGGVDGVVARKVQFENGTRLQLDASGGRTIDFSPALDVRPTATAWTGPTATVSGNEPTWAEQRLLFRVSGANLEVALRDPVSGNRLPVQTVALPPTSGPATVTAVGGLTLTLPAGSYRDGDAFAVEINSNGSVTTKGAVSGTHAEAATWSAGDASVTYRGRYTGDLGFVPGQQWSMTVLTSGTIGARSGSASTPPTVEFTYYTGTREAPVQQRLQVTLDQRYPAGTPVAIADGVYAEFGTGVLTAASGTRLDVSIDAHADEARLLPALGVNGMLDGDRAGTLVVTERLLDDPTQFAVGTTRAAGDNTNLLRFAAMREAKLFDDGGFALDDYYQTTIAEVGVRIQQSERQGESQAVLSQSLASQRNQVSGVSIDEEIGNLVLLQQAYQASARVISQARENMQALLGILG